MSKDEITAIPRTINISYDTYANFPVTANLFDLAYATDLRCMYYWNGAAWVVLTIYSLAGLTADIPAAAGLPNGSIYYATDTAVLYMKQGAAWLTTSGTEIYKKYKSANETVNNSTAFQNDNDLFMPIIANEICEIVFVLYINSSGDADIKFTITTPAGCAQKFSYSDVYWDEAATAWGAVVITASGTTLGGHGTGTANAKIAVIRAYIKNGANAGNVQLQWAQNTAEASNTLVEEGSYMTKINVP